MKIIDEIEKEQIKKDMPAFKVGDTVKVFSKIIEGGKERLQGFEGIVIKRQGGSNRASFTVRKLVQGIGVERSFLDASPRVARIQVVRSGQVRRAKLYYLRNRIGGDATRIDEGKAAAIKEPEKASS
jgi:large subunit ribosomal protein L19